MDAALRTPHAAACFAIPASLVRGGIRRALSAAGQVLLLTVSDEPGLRRARGVAPCIPHQGAPGPGGLEAPLWMSSIAPAFYHSPMSTEKTDALVIRLADFSESSRVVTFFTRDFGKISCSGEGGETPQGPFEGGS